MLNGCCDFTNTSGVRRWAYWFTAWSKVLRTNPLRNRACLMKESIRYRAKAPPLTIQTRLRGSPRGPWAPSAGPSVTAALQRPPAIGCTSALLLPAGCPDRLRTLPGRDRERSDRQVLGAERC